MYQYTISLSITSLSLSQCHLISHLFENFGFMPEFTRPSIAEFSVLRGVTSCLWSNTIKYGRTSIAVFPLLKVPHVSASAAEDTKLRIF